MPQHGTHTAASEPHGAGESKGSERAKGAGPKAGEKDFKGSGAEGKAKSRYNMATHTMRKETGKPVPQTDAGGSKSGFSGRTSRVRALEPHEHRAAAAVLHQAGHIHAAAHHTAAADHMEGQQDEDGAGNVGEGSTGQPKGQRAGSRGHDGDQGSGYPQKSGVKIGGKTEGNPASAGNGW